jgi:hypothetical protein
MSAGTGKKSVTFERTVLVVIVQLYSYVPVSEFLYDILTYAVYDTTDTKRTRMITKSPSVTFMILSMISPISPGSAAGSPGKKTAPGFSGTA